jgi:thioredoxin
MQKLIDEKTREGLKSYFVNVLDRDVTIDIFTDKNSEMSEFTIQFISELGELTEKVKMNIHPHKEASKYSISTDPVLTIGANLGYEIIFNGTPAGHEANSILEIIKIVSAGNSGLSPKTKQLCKNIDRKAKIQVFVTPTCPYCPYVAILSSAFVVENPENISLEIIEAQENEQLAQKYSLTSVPTTIINEDISTIMVGVQSEEKFLDQILKVSSSNYESIKPVEEPLPDNPVEIINLSDSNFKNAIKKYEKLVVDFWAEWCGPCKMMAPIMEQLSKKFNGRVTFAKINTDDNPVISAEYSVDSIPTFLFFQNGKQINRVVGARSINQLADEIISSFKLIMV